MARLSNFLLCGWRLLFSISAPSRGSSVQAAMYSNSLQHGWDLPYHGVAHTFSVFRREWKAHCKQRYAPTWLWGLDAPTPARTVGLPPRRGKYFLSKRKKVPKKAGGTATTGKRLLLPILAAGLAMSRAMNLDRFHLRLERARARLFPPSKWAGLFPSAAYRRSAPPQLAWSGVI